jgi:hypothetical protein
MRHGGQLFFAIGVLLTVFSIFNGQRLFSSAMAQGDSLADAAGKLTVLKQDTSIEFVACVSNNSWRKPTIDEQALRLERDERFGYFEDDERERFVASFWREGLDAGWGFVDYSGLWRIEDAGLDVVNIARAGCPTFKNPQGRTQINLWLLNHYIDSADMINGRLLIQVRRKDIGFQMVEVLAPRGTRATKVPIDFIDHEGRVLETIQPDFPWSRISTAPGVVPAPRQRPVRAVEVVPGTRTELQDAIVAPAPPRPGSR